jgi:DNA (cytosine-5)-methyltransferase 1
MFLANAPLSPRKQILNVLDLFSGVGGFSLGLERAGMRTVAFWEIASHAKRVLGKHWPRVPVHGDITKYDFEEGQAEVITAGFPCQDISLAGEGTGITGERSGLYREVIRAIRVVRPKFAVLENVAALLSRGMGTVLGDLAEIGYDAEWHCIPASAVGAPHRRDRVWIIADPRGEQYESNRPPFSGALAAELLKAATDANRIFGNECRPSDPQESERGRNAGSGSCGEDLDDAVRGRYKPSEIEIRAGRHSPFYPGWWSAEPDVGRVANGIPSRVDRLSELGNAIVPKIAEIIGRAITAA